MSDSEVTVLVITHNGFERLKKTLPTVISQDWPGLKVVVVDDGSTDGTPVKVSREFPQVRLITLSIRLGFGGASNAGVRDTTGDYFAVVRDDVYLPTNFVGRMVNALKNNPRAAIAGPGVYDLKLNRVHSPHASSISLTGSVIPAVFNNPAFCFETTGYAMMVKRDLIEHPFDADYQSFYNNTYLAWQSRLKGHTVVRLPDIVVKPLKEASAEVDNQRFLMERNRYLNVLTLFSWGTRLRIGPLMFMANQVIRSTNRKAGLNQDPFKRARKWIRTNKKKIVEKRRILQAERRVPDKIIFQRMTYKITSRWDFYGRIMNSLAGLWCRIMGLKTWERVKKKQDI